VFKKIKMVKNALAAGLRPGPRWGACAPTPSSWTKGRNKRGNGGEVIRAGKSEGEK